MKRNTRYMGYLASVGVGLLVLGGVGCSGGDPIAPLDPVEGQSDFVSASTENSQGNRGDFGAEPGAAEDDGSGNSGEKTVEEGDIYRLYAGHLILNLNNYRGLQVIDFADPAAPRIVGRLRIAGYPVEMYAVEDRAYLLLNDYRAYYGNRTDVQVDTYEGGLVVAVDLADPTQPRVTGQARVPGWIMTSRLTRLGSLSALYVAASNWNQTSTTVVRSFALSPAGEVLERDTIDLGGYVADIQATPNALLVARTDWSEDWSEYHSVVSLIDITDPTGVMIQGADIQAAGYLTTKFNMDLEGSVLRLVSGSTWSGTNTNHLETFDVTDIHHPVPADHDTFGAGEQLFATLFLPDRAFFVTFFRTDPFHAFSIDPSGQAVERSEFIVSGWNDFFKPVLGDSRLVGVGVDDQNGWSMAISLYDITDLENPNPLVARAPVETSNSWSEARWDDKAFSVIDGAVSVPGPDGSLETGLVLLPFSGWNQTDQTYTSGVQIFTYSPTSLTRRGVMPHGTWVRRSFPIAEGTTANLSDLSLSLFDTSDPDDPAELGRLDLAPNYTRFLIFGEYGARLKNDRDFYYGWWADGASMPSNELQIVSLAEDPDLARPLASVPVPPNGQVHQLGELAVVTETQWLQREGTQEYFAQTNVQVWDLADPLHPRQAGALSTDQIQPYYGYYYGPWGAEDCWDCGYYYGYANLSTYAVGQALAFPATVWEQEEIGTMHSCTTQPVGGYQEQCTTGEDGQPVCTYLYGNISCQRLNDGPEECYGEIQRCVTNNAGYEEWVCETVEPDSIPTETSCYDYPQYRYWSHFDIALLDLRDADLPAMGPKLSMPVEEEAVGLLAKGDDLLVSYRIPVDVPGDDHGYARYFFRRIGLADPSAPEVGQGINVPGELLDLQGEALFTRDFSWHGEQIESAVNKLHLDGDRAVLDACVRFRDREVSAVKLDGRGHLLVTHRLAWWVAQQDPDFDWSSLVDTLGVLDAGGSLEQLSALQVDSWSTLREAREGRALFAVPGGVLVVNLDDPALPFAQAYFPSVGWYQDLTVSGDDMYVAGGPYGMFVFDLDEFNLDGP